MMYRLSKSAMISYLISHIVCELVEEIVDLKTVNEWEQT